MNQLILGPFDARRLAGRSCVSDLFTERWQSTLFQIFLIILTLFQDNRRPHCKTASCVVVVVVVFGHLLVRETNDAFPNSSFKKSRWLFVGDYLSDVFQTLRDNFHSTLF